MTSRTPIMVVGLDACDPAIARTLAAAGKLPSLARLFDQGARCHVRNPYGLFVGSLWLSFSTGLRADRHDFHCWDEIDVPTYERRLTMPPSVTPFWQRLSDAGRRVAVIDVPHAKADVPIDGIAVAEWGCHDRHFGFHTWPASAAADIDSTFGLHPVFGFDAYCQREFAADDYAHRAGPFRTLDEDHVLLNGLHRGLQAKREMLSTLLAQGRWDLFLAVFGESHAIGHQQWHLHDPTHPRFDAAARDALGGDPVLKTYQELDGALGAMLAQVPDESTVLVLLSHGMGPHYDGTQLLDAVLTRIDTFDRGASPAGGAMGLFKRAGSQLISLRRQIAFAVPGVRRAAERPLAACAEFATSRQRARQRFFLEPNNHVYGGVRLNLAGREPRGCVQPHEVDAVCARLTDDLLALVNVATGDPVVAGVERAARWYRRSPTDTLPDLFVDWVRTAPIETVWSPKTGIVNAPYTNWRTGDHRPDGMLLAFGPGIPTNTALPAVDMEDLAPSIAARLGVGLADVDGEPVAWLARAH